MKQNNSIQGLYNRLHKITNRKLYNFVTNDVSEYKNKLWYHLSLIYDYNHSFIHQEINKMKLYSKGILKQRNLKLKDVVRNCYKYNNSLNHKLIL